MILITGGAGYIGSHTCVAFLETGQEVVVLDNLSNSHPGALVRIHEITGRQPEFVRGDIREQQILEDVIRRYGCHAVVHFAGLKAVGESSRLPLDYYDNNVAGTVSLLKAMAATGCKTLVFSSSATVYGVPQQLPIPEEHRLSVTNPYGRTKLMIEDMLRDFYCAHPDWRIAILRYFNPVGAHDSGLIGEDPQGIPNNLMPYIAQVAIGRREMLHVWGDDYPTHDGTGVRDYIHVVDLALGHLKALDGLRDHPFFAVNLGTGNGYSVLDVVREFERASQRRIPYTICSRRAGDVAACYAAPSLVERLLGWEATRDLHAMCRDHWRWQTQNPNGYMSA